MKLRKLFKSKLGFTLVELLVVIAMMAALAAIAVPSIASMQTKDDEDFWASSCKTVYNNAYTVVKAYNEALAEGRVAKIAGYNIESPVGMQQCLRTENNHASDYEIAVVLSADPPSGSDYAACDTVVVCIQFIDHDGAVLVNNDGQPIFPAASKRDQIAGAQLVCVWYMDQGQNAPAHTINGEQ